MGVVKGLGAVGKSRVCGSAGDLDRGHARTDIAVGESARDNRAQGRRGHDRRKEDTGNRRHIANGIKGDRNEGSRSEG